MTTREWQEVGAGLPERYAKDNSHDFLFSPPFFHSLKNIYIYVSRKSRDFDPLPKCARPRKPQVNERKTSKRPLMIITLTPFFGRLDGIGTELWFPFDLSLLILHLYYFLFPLLFSVLPYNPAKHPISTPISGCTFALAVVPSRLLCPKTKAKEEEHVYPTPTFLQ